MGKIAGQVLLARQYAKPMKLTAWWSICIIYDPVCLVSIIVPIALEITVLGPVYIIIGLLVSERCLSSYLIAEEPRNVSFFDPK